MLFGKVHSVKSSSGAGSDMPILLKPNQRSASSRSVMRLGNFGLPDGIRIVIMRHGMMRSRFAYRWVYRGEQAAQSAQCMVRGGAPNMMLIAVKRYVPSIRSSTHHGRRPRKDYPRDDGFRSGVSFSATFGIANSHCTAAS